MTTFRRSGSAVVYWIDGEAPDPRSPSFAQALAEHRFRTVEDAASEETSIGWVTRGDPSGDTFEAEDLDLDVATWLRVRIDKKSIPTAWLRIHRSAAERSAGRRLTMREWRELKQDLADKLLPRVLPTVQILDALYSHDSRRVLLFATATRARDEFHKLFFRTFATNLTQQGPHSLALHAGLERDPLAYLDEVSPVCWIGSGVRAPVAEDTAAPMFAGGEA
jgi:hypothetical protein